MSLRYDVIELRDVSSRPDVGHVRLETAVSKGVGQLVHDRRPTQHHRDLRLRDPGDHALRLVEVLEIEDIRRPLRSRRAKGIRTAARRDEEAVVRYLSAGLGVDGL